MLVKGEIIMFEVGKFYKHKFGRSIAVLTETKTFEWGDTRIMEFVDPSGHGITHLPIKEQDPNDEWEEITKEQWDIESKKKNQCFYCQKPVKKGEQYRHSNHGYIHEPCFQKFLKEPDDEVDQKNIH